MKTIREQGSHLIALSLAIVVIGVIGFAGYRVMHHDTKAASTIKQTVTAPAAIKTTSDLQQAAQSLNSSSADLNSDLNSDALNTSLNDLL